MRLGSNQNARSGASNGDPRRRGSRRALLTGTASVLALGALGSGAAAMSEYLGGVGFPYRAFDRLAQVQVPVSLGTIQVGFAPGDFAVPRATILAWIGHCARAVSTYYGRFPVPRTRLLIVPTDGSGVSEGTAWGFGGAAIRVVIGRDSDESDLRDDWTLVHEMVHLALPDLDEIHTWLSEGLAVYIEPIARVQAGDLTPETIWTDMIRDMPQGLPRRHDGDLDGSGSWGRIYWGGAVFCLRADVAIRSATDNRLGLQRAMRGVLEAGGSNEDFWPIERVLAVADRSVGGSVLSDLYAEMGSRAVATDLTALWRDLGVRAAKGGVTFDDTAPLAPIRAALTRAKGA